MVLGSILFFWRCISQKLEVARWLLVEYNETLREVRNTQQVQASEDQFALLVRCRRWMWNEEGFVESLHANDEVCE